MADRICTVEDCVKPAQARGLCSAHAHRLRRYGDPLGGPRAPYSPRPDRCTVEDCDEPCRARGYCSTHYATWKRTGDPIPRIHGKDDVNYWGAHKRLRLKRGRAADHACIDCGKPARDWSYRGEPGGWSGDVTQYDPRCSSCHARFDRR